MGLQKVNQTKILSITDWGAKVVEIKTPAKEKSTFRSSEMQFFFKELQIFHTQRS